MAPRSRGRIGREQQRQGLLVGPREAAGEHHGAAGDVAIQAQQRLAVREAVQFQRGALGLQRTHQPIGESVVAGQMKDDRLQEPSESWKMAGREATYCKA